MKLSKEKARAAHKHSSSHREEVLGSDKVGCFFCFEIYNPSEIEEWCDNDDTAICPECGIDSVIGSKSGYPVTKTFLKALFTHYFQGI